LISRRGIFFIAAGRNAAEQAGKDYHINISFHGCLPKPMLFQNSYQQSPRGRKLHAPAEKFLAFFFDAIC
jgi:hypothetical protein